MEKDNDFIRIATSIPSLKDKIHIRINEPTDKVYWYIEFNIPLDPASVSRNTINVTDTEGYILETDISYNQRRKLIEINPLENYEQDVYYILNISKQVRSAKLQNLKNDIHILFKLVDNVITEFKLLSKNIKIPKPKYKQTSSKVYSFDKMIPHDIYKGWLPSADVMINPLIGALGLIMTLMSILLEAGKVFIIISGVIALVGFIHIVIQLSKPEFRSNFIYNIGARCFNKEKYDKANKYFVKALNINPENEYAELGKNKVMYYI